MTSQRRALWLGFFRHDCWLLGLPWSDGPHVSAGSGGSVPA